jgi:bifunctional enzyme CysN/CysC
VVCGAVDDGKSTLIGRLLAETGSIPSDEARAAELPDGTLDFSRLTDGLESEREQGITIDVAYRYVRLPGGRRALLADSPGHEQYTRNMAVAASLADVALLVVDAVRGIRRQTLRHTAVCRLMGVRSYVVAINKIDAVENPEARFAELRAELEQWVGEMPHVTFVPVSGLRGDNVTGEISLSPPWSMELRLTEQALKNLTIYGCRSRRCFATTNGDGMPGELPAAALALAIPCQSGLRGQLQPFVNLSRQAPCP